MVLPRNPHEVVAEFLALIGLEAHSQLKVSVNESQRGQVSATSLIQFPSERPISAYELFAYWLNLSEAPSRHFCQILGTYLLKDPSTSTNEARLMKAEKLIHFASKTADGKSEYFSYSVRERRSCLELFKDFEITNQIPLEYLIQGIGRQRPREFSISSAPRRAE
mmetsp:Transcript_22234/g.29758  ORF Transcript_22234/g.29758 Transcript_22234/m.29758 type:complete len:165 (-) Transcript_22234:674-1168(-)